MGRPGVRRGVRGAAEADRRMSGWSEEELARIGRTDEIRVASRRPDGTLRGFVTIWSVRVGDGLYVRSAHGPDNPWFQRALKSGRGRVRGSGAERDVVFEAPGPEAARAVTDAYHAKYDRYGRRSSGPWSPPRRSGRRSGWSPPTTLSRRGASETRRNDQSAALPTISWRCQRSPGADLQRRRKAAVGPHGDGAGQAGLRRRQPGAGARARAGGACSAGPPRGGAWSPPRHPARPADCDPRSSSRRWWLRHATRSAA